MSKTDGVILADKAVSLRDYYASVDYMNYEIASPLACPDGTRKSHIIVFGGTRTGKTRLMMQDIRYTVPKGWNIITIDPKMEQNKSALFSVLVEAAKKAGREDDLMFIDITDPAHSVKFNPFEVFNHPRQIVKHMLNIMPEKKGEAEFYKNVADRVLWWAVDSYFRLCEKEGKKPKVTLSQLRKITSWDEMEKTFSIIEELSLVDPSAWEDLRIRGDQIVRGSDRKDFEKIIYDLHNVFNAIGTGTIGEIVDVENGTEIYDRIYNSKGMLLYIYTGSLILGEDAVMLSKLFMSGIKILSGLTSTSKASGRLDTPCIIYIDECHEVLFPGFEKLLTMAGGINFWLYLATQSVSNFDVVLGEPLRHVYMDNIGTQIFLNCKNSEVTGKYVSAKIGQMNLGEVWKSTTEMGDGGTYKEKQKSLVDSGFIGRIAARKFLAFIRGDDYERTWLGKVTNVPDPSIIVTDMPSIGRQVFHHS